MEMRRLRGAQGDRRFEDRAWTTEWPFQLPSSNSSAELKRRSECLGRKKKVRENGKKVKENGKKSEGKWEEPWGKAKEMQGGIQVPRELGFKNSRLCILLSTLQIIIVADRKFVDHNNSKIKRMFATTTVCLQNIQRILSICYKISSPLGIALKIFNHSLLFYNIFLGGL